MIWAGIDAGSRTAKVVLLEATAGRASPAPRPGRPAPTAIASDITDQGLDPDAVARTLLHHLLARAGRCRRDVKRVVATGYARHAISYADSTITEITCHARGVRHLLPDARTIIEMGGQDSKAIYLSADGAVRDFAMNDRCAAGSGRFLEVLAARFEVGLQELGDLAGRSEDPTPINSTCVVFAESEIIGLLANGARPADIAAGVEAAIATRVAALAAGKAAPPIVLTGGVALIPHMVGAIESVLRQPVTVAPQPQFTGALGAALLAAEAG